ncbi:MAG: serine/threonine-protein phosphatase [Zoogloea sp.]|nr:serine/threonine-protein phosphatase [Zoogloea sp.]
MSDSSLLPAENLRIVVDACVAKHIGDRKEQQDQVAIFPHPARRGLVLAVLADGMGGHSGGAMASEQVIFKAKQNFEAYAPSSETPAQLLTSIIEEAHVVVKLTRFTSEQDPHSTAVVLLLQPGRADWAHCGDSRLYHFRDGKLADRTEDHSLVAELIRKGRLDNVSAMHHPNRNMLLSCLGDERMPRVALGEAAPLVPGDAFLLCSDGVWAHFSDAELGRIIASQPAREGAEQIIKLARERADGEGDNISVAIIRLVGVPVVVEED